MAAAEQEAWNKTCVNKSGAALGKIPMQPYSRIASAEEVAPLVEAALEALAPADPDAGKEFGRGKRPRGAGVSYQIK